MMSSRAPLRRTSAPQPTRNLPTTRRRYRRSTARIRCFSILLANVILCPAKGQQDLGQSMGAWLGPCAVHLSCEHYIIPHSVSCGGRNEELLCVRDLGLHQLRLIFSPGAGEATVSVCRATLRGGEFMAPKIAVVTGASKGVGRALSISLSRKGWRLILVARNDQGLLQTANCLQSHPDGHVSVPCDISIWADCNKVVEKVGSAGGAIGLLVNIRSPCLTGRSSA
jgi:hypothetical protein